MKTKKSVGMGIQAPQRTCTDVHCPFHGDLRLHGRTFVGRVTKKNLQKTVSVEWPRTSYVEKFERYVNRRSRVKAHNPPCVDANIGDKVTIVETRPISKTKTFVVVGVEK
ncbi:MAG TPA: 30S ribosomal protein S17 [Candidatus Nanoarchaeia archaeon]|nr:30S ribosomal protein S17 [Candidatus Nanoarchaeia archaeon]